MQALDVIYAYRQVDTTVSDLREGSEKEFSRIFAEVTTLNRQIHGEDFELKLPTLNKRQTYHSNILATTPEEYYQVSLYNEFLSHTTAELQERFCDNPPQGF